MALGLSLPTFWSQGIGKLGTVASGQTKSWARVRVKCVCVPTSMTPSPVLPVEIGHNSRKLLSEVS